VQPGRDSWLSDKIFRFHFCDPAQISLDWLDEVLKSPALRAQIITGATGTSPTMKNISKEKVLRLLIPSHSAEMQFKIIAELSALLDRLREVMSLQDLSVAELDALLPSVLDSSLSGQFNGLGC